MSTLLELTWRGALMLVVVASLDRLCATRISARVRRAWWLLVPLAFLVTVTLPVLPKAISLPPQSFPSNGVVTRFTDTATLPVGQAAAVAPSSIPLASWALVIVLAGSSVYLLAVLGRTCAALRRWSRVPPCLDPRLLLALEECKAEAGITAPIGLAVSERVHMPLLLGWRRPRILLPATLTTSLSREQLRGVLFHELAHLRSRDVPCTFLFTLVCALHWFNPAAHLALRWWTQFREEAADEAAIGWLGQASNLDYGETLLHVLRVTHAQPAGPFLTLSIVESVGQLRTRLTMIKHHERRSPYPLFTGTVFAAAALGILLRPVRAQNALVQTSPAGETAVSQHYTAKAIFQYVGQLPPDAEKVFADSLPRGERSAIIRQVPATQVFEVSVSASSPEAAAKRANQVVLSFRDLLSDPNATKKSVLILTSAKASETLSQTTAGDFTLQGTAQPLAESTPPPRNAWPSRPADWPARSFEFCRVFTEPQPNTQPEVHQTGRDGEKTTYYVEKSPVLDEGAIQSVEERNVDGQHTVVLVLTAEASQRFAEFTRQNVGQRIEMFCNGWPLESFPITKPFSSSEIVLRSNLVPWLKTMVLASAAPRS